MAVWGPTCARPCGQRGLGLLPTRPPGLGSRFCSLDVGGGEPWELKTRLLRGVSGTPGRPQRCPHAWWPPTFARLTGSRGWFIFSSGLNVSCCGFMVPPAPSSHVWEREEPGRGTPTRTRLLLGPAQRSGCRPQLGHLENRPSLRACPPLLPVKISLSPQRLGRAKGCEGLYPRQQARGGDPACLRRQLRGTAGERNLEERIALCPSVICVGFG